MVYKVYVNTFKVYKTLISGSLNQKGRLSEIRITLYLFETENVKLSFFPCYFYMLPS